MPSKGMPNTSIAVLTPDDVRFLRRNYIPNSREFGMRGLAKRLGVSRSTIGRVVRREMYLHVKEEV